MDFDPDLGSGDLCILGNRKRRPAMTPRHTAHTGAALRVHMQLRNSHWSVCSMMGVYTEPTWATVTCTMCLKKRHPKPIPIKRPRIKKTICNDCGKEPRIKNRARCRACDKIHRINEYEVYKVKLGNHRDPPRKPDPDVLRGSINTTSRMKRRHLKASLTQTLHGQGFTAPFNRSRRWGSRR